MGTLEQKWGPNGDPKTEKVPMGTGSLKWGPNGNPKTEKGHHGDRVPQMGTHEGAVLWS